MSFHSSFIRAPHLLFYLFFVYCVIAAAAFLYLNSPVEFSLKEENREKNIERRTLDISGENLFPSTHFSIPSFPNIADKLKMVNYEPRPDEGKKEKCFELTLLTDGAKRLVYPGEKIFLDDERGLKFSDDPTDFWLSFTSQQPDKIKATMAWEYRDPEGRERIKEEFFDLTCRDQEMNPAGSIEESNVLQKAIFLGPDLSLDICEKSGGNKQLSRLIFPANETIYVKRGDILIYKEGQWQMAGDEDTRECSLARINSLNESFMEIDFWKRGEAKKSRLKLMKPSLGTALRIGDDYISELNIRTKKQVSCKIQGQRMIIKERDLLFKKDGLWRKGSLADLDNKNGISEFFLFDKLECSSGKKNFIGYAFNSDRTQVVKVEKNILKKPSNTHSGKNANLSQNKKRR